MNTPPRRSRRLQGLEPEEEDSFECHRDDVPFLVSSGKEGLSNIQISAVLCAFFVIVPLLLFAVSS